MGRYDGEDYAERVPCREGGHKRAFNGWCSVCRIKCTYDGLSEPEKERRTLRAENERLREALLRVTESGCDSDYDGGCVEGFGDVMGNWCQACLAAFDARAALIREEPDHV